MTDKLRSAETVLEQERLSVTYNVEWLTARDREVERHTVERCKAAVAFAYDAKTIEQRCSKCGMHIAWPDDGTDPVCLECDGSIADHTRRSILAALDAILETEDDHDQS